MNVQPTGTDYGQTKSASRFRPRAWRQIRQDSRKSICDGQYLQRLKQVTSRWSSCCDVLWSLLVKTDQAILDRVLDIARSRGTARPLDGVEVSTTRPRPSRSSHHVATLTRLLCLIDILHHQYNARTLL